MVQNHPAVVLSRSQEADTDRAISIAQSDFGGLDGLVVCAAVEPTPTRIIDMAYSTYLRAITINVAGSFLSIQRSLPFLRSKESGRPTSLKPRLLVLSSKADQGKQAGRVGYTSSKAALTSLIKTLINEERESGVEVLGIYPGLTNTPLAKGLIERKHDDVMWPEEAANYKRWIEGGKVEGPEWCGEACAKLVVGASPGLPGQMARYVDHCPELKHGWWFENSD